VTIFFSIFSLLPPSPPPGGSPPYGEDRPPLTDIAGSAGFRALAAERQSLCLDESTQVQELDRHSNHEGYEDWHVRIVRGDARG
jgi:hypothetical protein